MPESVIRIALIDDDQEDYLIIKDLIEGISHTKYKMDWFANSTTGLEALKNHNYDVYLVDYRLDSRTGLDLLDEIQKQEIKKSIILLTGHGDHKVDIDAMNKGASDFLYKDQLTSENLERSIRYCIKRNLDQEKINEAEKLRLEKEMADSSNRAKTMFLANVSHEIRSPLGIIMGFTDLALDPQTSADERNDFLHTIKRNSAHLLELINDILDLSKVESGQFQICTDFFNWRDLIHDVIKNMRPKNRALALNFEDNLYIPALLKSDAHRVRQILINLVSNAVKFTESGGVKIISHTENITGVPKFIIDVTDTGLGLSEDEQAKLFKPYQQASASVSRRYGGTGLGLDLSRKLAQAMGGDLQLLSSVKGLGSTFRLTLPADFKAKEIFSPHREPTSLNFN